MCGGARLGVNTGFNCKEEATRRKVRWQVYKHSKRDRHPRNCGPALRTERGTLPSEVARRKSPRVAQEPAHHRRQLRSCTLPGVCAEGKLRRRKPSHLPPPQHAPAASHLDRGLLVRACTALGSELLACFHPRILWASCCTAHVAVGPWGSLGLGVRALGVCAAGNWPIRSLPLESSCV